MILTRSATQLNSRFLKAILKAILKLAWIVTNTVGDCEKNGLFLLLYYSRFLLHRPKHIVYHHFKCWLGVMEPALFPVLLNHKPPLSDIRITYCKRLVPLVVVYLLFFLGTHCLYNWVRCIPGRTTSASEVSEGDLVYCLLSSCRLPLSQTANSSSPSCRIGWQHFYPPTASPSSLSLHHSAF